MKKKAIKNLSLNKKQVSNLNSESAKGGLRWYTDLGCSLRGDCGTDTCGISCNGGSECHCL